MASFFEFLRLRAPLYPGPKVSGSLPSPFLARTILPVSWANHLGPRPAVRHDQAGVTQVLRAGARVSL